MTPAVKKALSTLIYNASKIESGEFEITAQTVNILAQSAKVAVDIMIRELLKEQQQQQLLESDRGGRA